MVMKLTGHKITLFLLCTTHPLGTVSISGPMTYSWLPLTIPLSWVIRRAGRGGSIEMTISFRRADALGLSYLMCTSRAPCGNILNRLATSSL